jgi:hypothetical protein
MTLNTHASRSSRSCCLSLVLFFLFLLPPPPARAVESRQPPPVYAGWVSQPLPAWSLSWTKIGGVLGSRRRMFQFATIGMCIGLYIMMRK